MYNSTDGGDTWSDPGLTNSVVRVLAIDPLNSATVYAGTSDGVFKSTDGGSTWIASGLTDTDVRALAIDPTTPTTVYAGSSGAGVSKSTDGGIIWNTLNSGLTNLSVNALAIDSIESRRVYAGTDGGVFAIEQAQVVGTGTPESCTEAALDGALAGGGRVSFDCGPDPVTITLTSEKAISADTIIDGGGRITLSGGGKVRIFTVDATAGLEVQNLTIADARGAWGGSIANFGTLSVTNSRFADNNSASATSGGYAGAIGNFGAVAARTRSPTAATISGSRTRSAARPSRRSIRCSTGLD